MGLVRHFFHRVAVPRRDADGDGFVGGLNLCLAGQAGTEVVAGRFFDAVQLFVLWFVEAVFALVDVDVAGRAGGYAAAGVLDCDVVFERQLKQGLAQRALDLDRLVGLVE